MVSQIKIIYEDDDILIIDKPSGLLTHPVRNSRAAVLRTRALGASATSNGTHPKNKTDKSESVVSWLLEKYPEIAKVGEDKTRPGIVHRLDKESSGLLLIAKNQKSFEYLKKLFRERKIQKTYLALVYGRLKNKRGVIETPLGKLRTRQTTRIHGKHELKEKTAITRYRVLKEFSFHQLLNKPTYVGLFNTYSLLEVSPLTGRTHQIRIHLKSIGHPIVCDPLYAGKKLVCPPELGRLFLHAQKLAFTTPSGQALAVESELPAELSDFLKGLPKNQK